MQSQPALFRHLREERRAASLKVVACRLRRKIGDEAIETLANGYSLHVTLVESLPGAEADAWRWQDEDRMLGDAERLVAKASKHSSPASSKSSAATLLRGEPLATLECARELSSLDPLDEHARDLTVAVHFAGAAASAGESIPDTAGTTPFTTSSSDRWRGTRCGPTASSRKRSTDSSKACLRPPRSRSGDLLHRRLDLGVAHLT